MVIHVHTCYTNIYIVSTTNEFQTIVTHTASTSTGAAGSPICSLENTNELYFVGVRKFYNVCFLQ